MNDEELRNSLNMILLKVNGLGALEEDFKEMSKDLSVMKGQMTSIMEIKPKVEELVLKVNTLEAKFKIVWTVFAFGFVSVGTLVVGAVFTGLKL